VRVPSRATGCNRRRGKGPGGPRSLQNCRRASRLVVGSIPTPLRHTNPCSTRLCACSLPFWHHSGTTASVFRTHRRPPRPPWLCLVAASDGYSCPSASTTNQPIRPDCRPNRRVHRLRWDLPAAWLQNGAPVDEVRRLLGPHQPGDHAPLLVPGEFRPAAGSPACGGDRAPVIRLNRLVHPR
jgi:hypothetical protein